MTVFDSFSSFQHGAFVFWPQRLLSMTGLEPGHSKYLARLTTSSVGSSLQEAIFVVGEELELGFRQ